MHRHIATVNQESSKEIQDRVYRLRNEVYLEEMKLPLQDEAGRLVDEFDQYSTNLLLTQESEDIGTVRITSALDGPMEIVKQSPAWKQQIDTVIANDTNRVCELTRLMVRQYQRGGEAVARLFDAVVCHCVVNDIDVVFLAGKVGKFSRFYGMFGAQVVDHTPVEYVIDDHVLGKYYLMKVDLRIVIARLIGMIWKFTNRELVKSLGL